MHNSDLLPASPARPSARRFLINFLLSAALSGSVVGCAFIESAAEITVQEPDIQPLTFNTKVTLDQVNNALFQGLPDEERILAESLGLLLPPGATYISLRSTLCELWKIGILPAPRVDVTVSGQNDETLKSLVFRLEVPIGPDVPVATCLQTGFRAQALVEFMPWTPEQAAEVKAQLNTELSELRDAIVQIRFKFSQIDFLRGDTPVTSQLIEDFSITLGADIPDDPTTVFDDGRLLLVPYFLLGTVSPETPQRFELDPDSPVTTHIQDSIMEPPTGTEAKTLGVEALVSFKESELANMPIEASGFALTLQPEIVINVLEVL